MPRFLVIEDHPLMRVALTQTLAEAFPACVVHAVGSFSEALGALGVQAWDMVLLDVRLSGADDHDLLANLRVLRARYPAVKVAVVSGVDHPALVQQALTRGAHGFIPKSESAQDMGRALSRILAGEIYVPKSLVARAAAAQEPPPVELTDRQLEVVAWLIQGCSNNEIAAKLGISLHTVKSHVAAIIGALQVESRTQALHAIALLDQRHFGWRTARRAPANDT
jgi:DNA-binding NarL/FixJ family response regulator